MVNIAKAVGGFLGTAADLLTPGSGSNRLTDWSGYGDAGRGATSTAPKAPTSTFVPYKTGPSSAEQSTLDESKRLLAQIAAMNRPVYAPQVNWAGINAQARGAAEAAVNPFYTKQLTDFLAGQSAKQSQKQTEYDLNLKDIESKLKQDTEQNALNRTRVGEDTALAQQQINTQADQFQTDSGNEFEDARAAMGQNVAAAGTGTAGIGKQQTNRLVKESATGEQRKEAEFQQNRDAQELFKTRSFEDLMKSDELAGLGAASGKERQKFNLDSYITNLGFETESGKGDIEQNRLSRLIQEEGNQSKALINAWVESIKDPGQRDAARRAYL